MSDQTWTGEPRPTAELVTATLNNRTATFTPTADIADALTETASKLFTLANQVTAECPEGSIDIMPTHAGCPCRKTGPHRVHMCEHSTEWWRDEEPIDAAHRSKMRRDIIEEIAAWFETEAREGTLERDRPVQIWTVAEVWQEAARIIRAHGDSR